MNLAYGPLDFAYMNWPIRGHDLCRSIGNWKECLLIPSLNHTSPNPGTYIQSYVYTYNQFMYVGSFIALYPEVGAISHTYTTVIMSPLYLIVNVLFIKMCSCSICVLEKVKERCSLLPAHYSHVIWQLGITLSVVSLCGGIHLSSKTANLITRFCWFLIDIFESKSWQESLFF